MKYFIFLHICLLHISLNAQKQDIEIEEERDATQIRLFAVNNTTDDLDLTFHLDISGFTINEKLPIIVVLNPNVRQYLVTLTAPKGVRCQYNSSISYKKIKKQAPSDSNAGKNTKTTGTQINSTKINVFTMNGCARCAYLIKYLQDNKIPFLELNTTIHQPNNDLMFEKLKETGFKGKNVQMPVIVNKGKVDFNIKNIQEFVKSMK